MIGKFKYVLSFEPPLESSNHLKIVQNPSMHDLKRGGYIYIYIYIYAKSN